MKSRNFLFAIVILALTTLVLHAQSVDSKSALKRGDAYVAQENYKAAIAEYGEVSERDRDSYARAIYDIGVCHYELWQTEEAIIFYKRAIDLKQGNYPRASYALGVAFEDQRKTLEAKQAYQQAITASRNKFAPAMYRLGVLEAQSGEFEKAAELFRNAASRKGRHQAASHNNLGVMLAQLGFYKEAEKEFVMALKDSDGKLSDAAHNLTLCRSVIRVARTIQNGEMKLLG